MADAPDVRASDADRDRVAQQMRDHFAAGRLSEDEMDERVQAAYDAKTQADLDRLGADLPPLPATRSESRAELAERRKALRAKLLQRAGFGLVPFIVCTFIWAASGADSAFWPVWTLFALIPLLMQLWTMYGPSPDLDRVERELDQGKDRSS